MKVCDGVVMVCAMVCAMVCDGVCVHIHLRTTLRTTSSSTHRPTPGGWNPTNVSGHTYIPGVDFSSDP